MKSLVLEKKNELSLRPTCVHPAAFTFKLPDNVSFAEAAMVAPPGDVRFMPYLSGERTPHNDADVRGGFTGLSAGTTRANLTRAVLEGVAFGLRDSFEALAATDARMDKIIAIGGGSASRYWLQLIATVLGVPLQLPGSREFGAALGAARLGIMAASGTAPENVITAPEIQEEFHPERDHAAAFHEAYQKFKAAYPGIKAIQ